MIIVLKLKGIFYPTVKLNIRFYRGGNPEGRFISIMVMPALPQPARMKANFFIFKVLSIFLIFSFIYLSGCAFKPIKRFKNITYLEANPALKIAGQQLNVFAPRKSDSLKEVLVFIYGGSWNSGSKSLYSFFGSRMARKGVVTVIIDYPLSPKATYKEMAVASAKAVIWVKNNIRAYGGDPAKVFISGHSAGGHLATLIAIKEEYFNALGVKNPVKGVILIDAAGLDMYGYLQEEKFPAGHTYLQTFTPDPANWKDASPLYHLHQNMPPLLIYRGENTYPSIQKSTEKFVTALKNYVPAPDYHILKGKKHIPMMTQFINPWNPLYQEIITFMRTGK